MNNIKDDHQSERECVTFDEIYMRHDVQAAELFLSRLLAEHVIVNKIYYGNRPVIGKIVDAPRSGVLPGWNKIQFIIEYFNGDTQLRYRNDFWRKATLWQV